MCTRCGASGAAVPARRRGLGLLRARRMLGHVHVEMQRRCAGYCWVIRGGALDHVAYRPFGAPVLGPTIPGHGVHDRIGVQRHHVRVGREALHQVAHGCGVNQLRGSTWFGLATRCSALPHLRQRCWVCSSARPKRSAGVDQSALQRRRRPPLPELGPSNAGSDAAAAVGLLMLGPSA